VKLDPRISVPLKDLEEQLQLSSKVQGVMEAIVANVDEIENYLKDKNLSSYSSPVMHSYKEGRSDGLTWSMLVMWFIGLILTLVFTITEDLRTNANLLPLIINLICNLICVSIMLKYKINDIRHFFNNDTRFLRQFR